MKLNLRRPLAFIDLETTGTNVGSDRIVEIAVVKLMPDGSMNCRPEKSGPGNRFLVNPEMPIPLSSSVVHGIYDEDIKEAPTFKEVAPSLFKFLFDCDLAGFNSNRFDIPMLAEEFLRAGIEFSLEGRNLIDVQVIFHMMEQRNLKAGYKFYCGKDLDDAHEALPDAMATMEIFLAMLDRYKDVAIEDGRNGLIVPIVNDMDKIHEFCRRQRFADLMGRMVYDEEDQVVFNFGKYKGKRVKEILRQDPGYYSWMMQGDFPLFTKKVLTEIRNSL